MPQVTKIEWTDFTSNPIKYRDKATGQIVWACEKASPGCTHCYAETLAKRYNRGGPFTPEKMRTLEPFVCEKELKAILTSKVIGGKRVFIGDMTDAFGHWVTDKMLDAMFAAFALRPDVTFQVLTKRADRMAAYLTRPSMPGSICDAATLKLNKSLVTTNYKEHSEGTYTTMKGPPWPLPNVWCGFSAESQEWFDKRAVQMASLMRAGWLVFVSAEPLLGPIKMQGFDGKLSRNWLGQTAIRWVIVGGESGAGSRQFQFDWAKSIQAQCDEWEIPFFMKQAGSVPMDWTRGDSANHEPPELVQLRLKSRKGGDLSELPSALQCRDFPTVEA